jgi:hypothetical protein
LAAEFGLAERTGAQLVGTPLDNLAHEQFAQLVAIGWSRTKAAREARCTPDPLRYPEVYQRVNALREYHAKALQMGPEEVMARIAAMARFDPRDMYDVDGNPIPVAEWGADLAMAATGVDVEDEVVEAGADGDGSKAAVRVGTRKLKVKSEKARALEMLKKHYEPAGNGAVGTPTSTAISDMLSRHCAENRGVADLLKE